MKLRILYTAFAFFSFSFLSPINAQHINKPSNESHAIIVLDASGSMWGQVNGEAKISIARRAIDKLLQGLPENLNLGLVAYGHRRKGDCKDIEVLIKPQKVDIDEFNKVVKGITPKGMTPLTDAVVYAAEQLAYKEQKCSVILISDGKETCKMDPCKAATELENLGVDFTAHVIAFDLTEEDAKSIECLATNTGGKFLKANNANNLVGALKEAIDEVEKKVEPEAKKVEYGPASLTAPESIPASSAFEVEWEGPNDKGDYITIVTKDSPPGKSGSYAYTKDESPSKITAPIKIGDYEVRYVSGIKDEKGNRKVLAKQDIKVTEVTATINATDEVIASAEFKVEWTGPNSKGDFITISPKGSESKVYGSFRN